MCGQWLLPQFDLGADFGPIFIDKESQSKVEYAADIVNYPNYLILSKETFMTNKVRGSVMVVGGGIAGMQASLDLADSGFLVHLVEKSSAIGGVMSELDKTFPTNDCSM